MRAIPTNFPVITLHSALSGLDGDQHSGHLVNAPASSARNLITSGGAAVVPLTIRLHASQSGNGFELQNSAGTVQSRFTNAGNLSIDTASVANRDAGPFPFQVRNVSSNRFFIVHDSSATRMRMIAPNGTSTFNFECNDSSMAINTGSTGLQIITTGAQIQISAANGSFDLLQGSNFFRIRGASSAQLLNVDANGGLFAPITALTNTVNDSLIVGHNTSGTPAANYGTGILLRGESSTTENRDMARLASSWIIETDASRTSRLAAFAFNGTTPQEGWRVDANSGGVRLGFYGGSAAVAKQTVSGSRADPEAALANLLTALANLGLLTNSTTV